MNFASSARAAEDSSRWKGIVTKSFDRLWCPNNLTRLWDRLEISHF